MDSCIGAFEAKAQLSRLLRAVEHGERFTITIRGRPVADLVPHRVNAAASVSAAVRMLQTFPRVRGVSDAEVLGLVAEGRR